MAGVSSEMNFVRSLIREIQLPANGDSAMRNRKAISRDFGRQRVNLMRELPFPGVPHMNFARVSYQSVTKRLSKMNISRNDNSASEMSDEISRVRCITTVLNWTVYITVLYTYLSKKNSARESSPGLGSGMCPPRYATLNSNHCFFSL